jgi:hypothetical protein
MQKGKGEGKREKGKERRENDSGFDQGLLRIRIKDRDSGSMIRD